MAHGRDGGIGRFCGLDLAVFEHRLQVPGIAAQVAVALLQGDEVGNLGAARRAPRREEVDDAQVLRAVLLQVGDALRVDFADRNLVLRRGGVLARLRGFVLGGVFRERGYTGAKEKQRANEGAHEGVPSSLGWLDCPTARSTWQAAKYCGGYYNSFFLRNRQNRNFWRKSRCAFVKSAPSSTAPSKSAPRQFAPMK